MTPWVSDDVASRRGPRLWGMLVIGGMTLVPLVKAQAQQTAPAATTQTPAAAGALPATFDVNEFIVRGNTTLSSLDVEKAVYPFEGPGRTLKDVNAARDALQKVYQDNGYQSVAVELP